MANSPHDVLKSAIGLLSHEDPQQRAAALHGATVLLSRHGIDWRKVGEIVAGHLGRDCEQYERATSNPSPSAASFTPAPFRPDRSSFREGFAYSQHEAYHRVSRATDALGPERLSGVEIPTEVIGRIVVQDSSRMPDLVFEVDDSEEIYGPIAAVPGAAWSILNASGKRAVVKTFPLRSGSTMPRAYEITLLD